MSLAQPHPASTHVEGVIDASACGMSEKSEMVSSQIMTSENSDGIENLEDYETQLFGFTPKSFVSGSYNAVSEYFMEVTKILENYIADHYADIMTRSEVEEKMRIIRRHLVKRIDKAFDNLETYLATNILCIPPNVVLPEDQVQMDAPVSKEEYEQVLEETEQVKKKILGIKLANVLLKQRVQETLQMQENFDSILKQLEDAKSIVKKEGVVDLRDSLKHCRDRILSTIRTLRDLEIRDSHSNQQDDQLRLKKKKSSAE